MVDHGGIDNIRAGSMVKRTSCFSFSIFFFLPASLSAESNSSLNYLIMWVCSKFAIIPFYSTFQYILFAYNLIIGHCKTASQNQLENNFEQDSGTDIKI